MSLDLIYYLVPSYSASFLFTSSLCGLEFKTASAPLSVAVPCGVVKGFEPCRGYTLYQKSGFIVKRSCSSGVVIVVVVEANALGSKMYT